MYMHRLSQAALGAPDVKKNMLRTLEAINNYLVTEATESEMFTLRVVREIFANARSADIERVIKKLERDSEK